MNQYTVTYRTVRGLAKFAFLNAESRAMVRAMIEVLSPGATVLTIRENVIPLETVAEVRA